MDGSPIKRGKAAGRADVYSAEPAFYSLEIETKSHAVSANAWREVYQSSHFVFGMPQIFFGRLPLWLALGMLASAFLFA